MTGGDSKKCTKGEILIVALKISATGRELLTWTLAKITRPGDLVIALHVSSSSSEANALRKTSDTANQQLGDIFEGFCSIQQIELQVKVIHSSSLKKVLIDEAKSCNATRLILGTGSKQSSTGSAFPLAKYCSNHVPLTCSVLVIQCGQIVFEKKGALENPASDKTRLLNTLQKTFSSRGRKLWGQNEKGRRATVSEKLSEIKRCGIFHRSGGGDLNNSSNSWNWSLPSSITNSPVSVKHVLPKVQSAKRLHNMKLSNSEYPEDPKVLGPIRSEINLERYFNSHESFRDHWSHHRGGQQFALADCSFNSQESVNSEWKTSYTGYSPHIDPEQCLQYSKSSNETLSAALRRPWDTSNVKGHSGWPLQHQSISVLELLNQLVSPCTVARRMSVVEWALQLPERKPAVIFEENSVLINCEDELFPSHLAHSGGELYGALGNCKQDGASEGSRETTFNECGAHRLPFINRVTSSSDRSVVVSHRKSCVTFQFSELQTATNNFSIENFVGKGGCSKVYRGVLSDGQVVAVKYLNSCTLDAEKDCLTEVEIISTLHHFHIVQLIGYCVDHENYLLVYNFATKGNLEQNLHHGVKGKAALPWNVRYKVAVGVAKALNYLHDSCSRPVIHRDVKSSNILLTSDLEPQLTDFGLAKWAPTTSTHITCSDVLGSFGYLAPEYFMYGKVNEKTDVYSFGVVLLELITGKHPVYSAKLKGQENLVLWARPLLEDESCFHLLIDPKLEEAYNTGELKNMRIAAALCLRQSPHSRPRMSRILKLLLGEYEDLELFMRQNPLCREMDDGYDMPNYRDSNIQTHLTMALFGIDDDAASQASIGHSGNLAYSNKFLENYLSGRYSRTTSFD